MRKIFLFLSFVLFVFLILPIKVAFAAPYAPSEVIVKLQPLVPDAVAGILAASNRVQVKEKLLFPRTFVFKVPSGLEEKLAATLSGNPFVSYAEPNFKAQALEVPNDTYFGNQWGLVKVKAPEAWDISHGASSVKIAILDTGIDRDHEDLASKTVARVNFTSAASDDDLNGHGSHVAGIASAITGNALGVAGLGYNASLVSVKVLDDSGSGYYSWIVNGIKWAADNGARVINLSLGGSSGSSLLKDAIDYAWSKGVVLACAAGNSGKSSPTYPAYYDNCIAVAATDNNDQKASWSSYGSWVDVAAPGVNIFSTLPNHKNSIGLLNYGSLSGTSMSTPFVAGLAGLIFGYDLNLTNSQVRSAIETYADDIAGTGTYWSQGRINAYRSLSSFLVATPTPVLTPTPSPSPTLSPEPTAILTPAPTVSPTPIEPVLCWSASNKYLYRSSSQAMKFCKCAQGAYGYNSYTSRVAKVEVYQYTDTSNDENWSVTSRSSNLPVYQVVCSDGVAYTTDRDYYWPK